MNPETFSGDQSLGQPAILLSLSPRVKGSYPWIPFRYFHRHLWLFYLFFTVLQERKNMSPVKIHDCSKFICRNHRSFGVFYIGIYALEDGN